MPAPVIYHDAAVHPYAHLSQEEKTTSVPVLYATNREPQHSSDEIPYGNGMSNILHLGEAQVRFGDHLTSWEDLYQASTLSELNSKLWNFIKQQQVPIDLLKTLHRLHRTDSNSPNITITITNSTYIPDLTMQILIQRLGHILAWSNNGNVIFRQNFTDL